MDVFTWTQTAQDLVISLAIKFAIAALVWFVLYMAAKFLVAHVTKRIEDSTLEVNEYTKKTSDLIWTVIYIICMIFIVLIVAEVVGIKTALIMWWLSLGIWFALETTIGNMVGGIMLLFNKKIKVGEMIEILWTFNTKATIQEFHIRYTVVSTLTKQRIIIPNMMLVKTPIKTYKSENLIKSSLVVSVGRHVSIEQAKWLIQEVVNNHEDILQKEDTEILITNFNAHGIELTCRYFMSPKDSSPFIINTILRKQLHEASKKYGILFAYNHVTLDTDDKSVLHQSA
jgi:small conductance mechanosensitive channel